jgi:hypothetical protein
MASNAKAEVDIEVDLSAVEAGASGVASTNPQRKRPKRRPKAIQGRSGIHAVLKECRLTEFEDALIAAGFTTAKDVSTEGHHMEQQLREVGMNRGQAKKLMTHARRFTNKKKDAAKEAIEKRHLAASPSTSKSPESSRSSVSFFLFFSFFLSFEILTHLITHGSPCANGPCICSCKTIDRSASPAIVER